MVDKSRDVERSRDPDRLVSAEGEIIKLRDKLLSEAAEKKQKDVEISTLKKHIAELTNDKKQVLQLIYSAIAGTTEYVQPILWQGGGTTVSDCQQRELQPTEYQART